MVRTSLALIVLLSVGCGAKRQPQVVIERVVETVEVAVEVPTTRTPPAVLFEPIRTDPPVFVAPGIAAASSALTAEGERQLRAFVEALKAKIAEWEAWAREP